MMVAFLVHAIANGIALWIITQLNFGVAISGWPSLILAAVILGLVNAIVRPIFSMVTCLINVLTLGLFGFVLNAIMLWITAWLVHYLGGNFVIDGIIPALIAGVLIGILNAIITPILHALLGH